MRSSHLLTAAFVLLLGSACAAFGESSPADQAEPLVDAAPTAPPRTAPPTATPTATQTTTNASPAPAPLPDPAACKAEATRQTCIECCVNPSNDGADAIDKAWLACACAPARCQAACAADVCATEERSPTNPTCAECLAQNGDACDAAEEAALTKLRSQGLDCMTASDCASKPSAPGKH